MGLHERIDTILSWTELSQQRSGFGGRSPSSNGYLTVLGWLFPFSLDRDGTKDKWAGGALGGVQEGPWLGLRSWKDFFILCQRNTPFPAILEAPKRSLERKALTHICPIHFLPVCAIMEAPKTVWKKNPLTHILYPINVLNWFRPISQTTPETTRKPAKTWGIPCLL